MVKVTQWASLTIQVPVMEQKEDILMDGGMNADYEVEELECLASYGGSPLGLVYGL